jgi:dethiobiotin synthetase
MKPVSAGAPAGAAVNEDVTALRAASNCDAPLAWVNPYHLAAPVAPHLAARAEGRTMTLDTIVDAYARLAATADRVVVEGAGGAMVPLAAHCDMLDIARVLRLPVVLVVGVRLGCLNHAALSMLAIRARGLRCAGWIANTIDPAMPLLAQNLQSLEELIPAARLATFAWQGSRFDIAQSSASLAAEVHIDALS